jgi:hypothetical protein
VRSGPGAARTILLYHIISDRPSKQHLMVRTFLKVYMEIGSYFLFLQEQMKDIIITQCNDPCHDPCHVTLSHTYTHSGGPTLHSKKFANKELRAHNTHHPKSIVPYPTISSLYITDTHYLNIPTTKLTKTQSASQQPPRCCPSGCVIQACTM